MIKKKIFLTAVDLKKKINSLKRKGPVTVIFTNGCFDILHAGHVGYLEKAKAMGDFLIVGLNADAFLKKYKGKGRPIHRIGDRLNVIAALESVDAAIAFGQDTPLALIKNLTPDILVKGGDWKPSQIVGAKEVKTWGGKVRSISFLKGRSTTASVKRIKNS